MCSFVAGVGGQPAQTQGLPALGPDLDRHLIGGAAHAAGLDLQGRHDVLKSLGVNLHGFLASLVLDDLEGAVDNLLRHALLAIQHDAVGELGNQDGVVKRVG